MFVDLAGEGSTAPGRVVVYQPCQVASVRVPRTYLGRRWRIHHPDLESLRCDSVPYLREYAPGTRWTLSMQTTFVRGTFSVNGPMAISPVALAGSSPTAWQLLYTIIHESVTR